MHMHMHAHTRTHTRTHTHTHAHAHAHAHAQAHTLIGQALVGWTLGLARSSKALRLGFGKFSFITLYG